MIFFAAPGDIAVTRAANLVAEHSISAMVYRTAAVASPPVEISLKGFEGGVVVKMQPHVQDVLEEFVWSEPKTQREFIRLEQKVLAKEANADERKRYDLMKQDRNGMIFADRYARDYAEVQRLKKLSEKLTEIQQYLRPIEI